MPDYPLSVNNRVYYATHAIGIGEKGAIPGAASLPGTAGAILPASGVQSVGINTTFNLEQVFQLGQLEIYENIENIPDVEVTLEKVLDGHALIQHLATPQATASSLATRYNNNRTDIHIGYYSDVFENASGVNQAELYCSGMYLSSMSVTLPTDGNATESVTLVGNDKAWSTGTAVQTGPRSFWYTHQSMLSSAGVPAASDGVLRRQDVKMSGCIFPNAIPGLTPIKLTATGQFYKGGGGGGVTDVMHFVPKDLSGGTNADLPLFSAATLAYGGINASGSTAASATDQHPMHISSVTISTDLGRTDLFELGKRGPYHRFADFPTEVTCAVELIEREFGDFVDAAGDADSNVSDSPIFIMLGDGTQIFLGSKNKLASITSTGGDTGGGNRTTTYNFSNFNAYQVHHPADPAVAQSNITLYDWVGSFSA